MYKLKDISITDLESVIHKLQSKETPVEVYSDGFFDVMRVSIFREKKSGQVIGFIMRAGEETICRISDRYFKH